MLLFELVLPPTFLRAAAFGGPFHSAIGSGMLINQPNNNTAPSKMKKRAETETDREAERFQIFAGNKRAARDGSSWEAGGVGAGLLAAC